MTATTREQLIGQWLDAGDQFTGITLLSDDELVRRLLHLVNSDAPDVRDLCAQLLGHPIAPFAAGSLGDRTRQYLAQYVRRELPTESMNDLCREAERLALRPKYHIQGDELMLKHKLVPQSSSALVAHLLLLAFSRFGSEICQCNYRECGRFFLFSDRNPADSGRRGKKSTKYCRPEHLAAEHKANGGPRAVRSKKKREQELAEALAHKNRRNSGSRSRQ